MKILHTISGLQRSSGGPSSCTYELVRALNQGGISTDILALAPKSADKAVVGSDKFIHLLPNDALKYAISKNFHRALRTQYQDYDLYHTNGLWLYPNLDTPLFCLKRHIPYVMTLHGMLFPYALSIKKHAKTLLRKLWFDRVLSRAACIHVTSNAELKYYRALGFTNPVALIPNCLAVPDDLDLILKGAKRDEVKRIVFLGRLHPIKNIDLMLRAWASLPPLEKTEFLIVGNGEPEYVGYLQTLCRTLAVKNVVFRSFVSGTEKFQLLAGARAVILASKMENFGMVVPEALMVGTPALAGDHTPWNSLPEHGCGCHVPTTQKDLAQAMSQILALSDDQLRQMGEAGRRYFRENFAAPAVASQMAALYRWILGTGDRPDFVDITGK